MNSFYQIINDQFYKKFSWIIILTPLSVLFFIVIQIRNFFYNIGLLKSFKLARPVIVVGNITLGGTGKTSLIQKIIEDLTKKKISVGVISRGYGGIVKHPLEVLKNSRVEDVGDEPLLLKNKYDIPIFVGKDKVSVGQFLIKSSIIFWMSDVLPVPPKVMLPTTITGRASLKDLSKPIL